LRFHFLICIEKTGSDDNLLPQHFAGKIESIKLTEKLHCSVKQKTHQAGLIAEAGSSCAARQEREQLKSPSW
jgi:hypothetical protein